MVHPYRPVIDSIRPPVDMDFAKTVRILMLTLSGIRTPVGFLLLGVALTLSFAKRSCIMPLFSWQRTVQTVLYLTFRIHKHLDNLLAL
jgi:hypothetical protein